MHTLISYWLICQETRNEEEVNALRLSVLGLFGFCKMTYMRGVVTLTPLSSLILCHISMFAIPVYQLRYHHDGQP